MLSKIVNWLTSLASKPQFSSENYWENRYARGGDSGRGSFGKFAQFKAHVLNDFCRKNVVRSVIEFGCGDGSQLVHFQFPDYIGLDVSATSIARCKELFSNDKSKSFFLYSTSNIYPPTLDADLGLSLDVIYHLVEDRVFYRYMQDLFAASKKWVIIYSSNTDYQTPLQARHVRHRCFSKWIEKNVAGWRLIQKVPNPHGSFADFYIYEKQ